MKAALVLLGVLATGCGAWFTVDAVSDASGPHDYASARVEHRADRLLTPFVAVCDRRGHASPAQLAAFRRSVDPFARLARLHQLGRWARACPLDDPASRRLRGAAEELGVY